MSTQTYDADVYEDGQQFKDDARLIVMFHMQPIKLELKSTEEGRPIFQDFEYITIITPGSRDTLVTEVTDQYRNRFRKQYENWKARTQDSASGTPLSELPWMTASQVMEFQYFNVKTIEQLVSLPDNIAQKFMGFHEVRARAKRFLEAAAGEAPGLVLEEKLKERDEKLNEQAELIKSMKAQLDKLTADAANKPVMPATTAVKK